MHLNLDNFPPYYDDWYESILTNISKDLATNPENNPIAAKKALEAIAFGKETLSNGLSECSYTEMQVFTAKIRSLDLAVSQALKEDLQGRVNQLFAQTHFSTISNDLLRDAIMSYLGIKELASVQLVSKSWNAAANQQPDIKLVKYFIQLQSYLQNGGIPPILDIEKKYFDCRSFADLQKAIGKTVDFQKLLTTLLHDLSLRPASSAAENLTFYLMQNLGWDVEDPVLQSAPISETEIGRLSENISNLMKNNPSKDQNWDIILKYPKAFIQTSLSESKQMLENWALSQLKSKNFTDIKQVVLLALKLDGFSYKEASAKLKQDSEIIDAALRNQVDVLFDLEPSLRTKSRILLAIKQCPDLITKNNFIDLILKDAHYSDKKKTQFIRKALNQDASVFEHLPSEWRSNEAIATLAIEKNGSNFKHASSQLQNDPKLILLALKNDASTVIPIAKRISENDSLKNNLELQEALDDAFLEAIKMSKEDPNLEESQAQIMQQVKELLFKDSQIIEGLRLPITDKNRALKLIQKEEWMALFMKDTFKADGEFLKEAIKENSKVKEVIRTTHLLYTTPLD